MVASERTAQIASVPAMAEEVVAMTEEAAAAEVSAAVGGPAAEGAAVSGLTLAQLSAMLRRVDLLNALGELEIAAAAQELETQAFKAGEVIYRQDDHGGDCFFVVAGECYATKQLYTLEEGTRVIHGRRGIGTVTEVTDDPSITLVVFDQGDSHRYTPASLHKLKPVVAVEPKVLEVMQYRPGDHPFFGERALSRNEPRPATITCRTDVTVLRLTADTFLGLRRQQDRKEDMLRRLALFETFSDDQIHQLACALQILKFHDKEAIMIQGEIGQHFYILNAGECVVTRKNGNSEEEIKRYFRGELFGEKALLQGTVHEETVTAVGSQVCVWSLSREAFETRLGSLSQLKKEQNLTDPRRLISDFYGKGDSHGPAGTVVAQYAKHVAGGALAKGAPHVHGVVESSSSMRFRVAASTMIESSWFAVYRPCSRDSIAKMVSRIGTGKGLNIKGKSAKKNRLSGFVPFLQISRNEHKKELGASPSDARTRIFYQSAAACAAAHAALESSLVELQVEKGQRLKIDAIEIRHISQYEPDAYGLDVPEALLKEVYILRADVSPSVGWETGRESEPAFLEMNLNALRDGGSPPVVLYQFDNKDPMNPLGLLMAYAEERVTPVVSDFDTFLVGSRGVRYDATPPEQVQLMHWALDHTTALLAEPNGKGWMNRWLDILTQEARNGFHPTLPEYGFGDPTSYGLIGSIIDAVRACGAVRHGAECFNFYFPQELDNEFLVVWDGLGSASWTTLKEAELRTFLLDRAREGYSFPINPVWPVRDVGWLEVLEALKQEEEAAINLQSWFPPDSGVLQRIAQIRADYPNGFQIRNATRLTELRRRGSVWLHLQDWDTSDLQTLLHER
eukprot:CAMPEP_0119346668 /NCGR_PEP_ID=MMETSP1333-20130426/108123_1 /TAXON_ID=418940 /ORGANISM="Scyphosphaera apsteinii, Strain RCC1455" /LENGTH=849 /DNA_ID=CAMNT_0007359179 /DNA_START=509 /DNA_END=3059 /DNA_ORIENTATION=-